MIWGSWTPPWQASRLARWTATSRCSGACGCARRNRRRTRAPLPGQRTAGPPRCRLNDPAGDVKRGPGRAGRGQHLHWFRLVPSYQSDKGVDLTGRGSFADIRRPGWARFPNLPGGPAGRVTRETLHRIPACITMHRRSPVKLPDVCRDPPAGEVSLIAASVPSFAALQASARWLAYRAVASISARRASTMRRTMASAAGGVPNSGCSRWWFRSRSALRERTR
jgi:hypothetical protein